MSGKGILIYLLTLCFTANGVIASETGDVINVQGHWIRDMQGLVMADPQPSGLVHWRNQLLTLSDRSALLKHQRSLHAIDKQSMRVSANAMPMQLADNVTNSCFGHYLAATPDLEALVVDPDDDSVFYTITEDATYAPLTAKCAKQWRGSGSTAFPTLLVRMQLGSDNQLTLTHVRPLKYQPEYVVGDFPNDGIEGLAFANDRWLYLALEKDKHHRARIFRIKMDDNFWLSAGFVNVDDPQLSLPEGDAGEFPLNGMDYYPSEQSEHPGYLIAAARNNDQLWIIDLAKQQPTRILQMAYWLVNDQQQAKCDAEDPIPYTAIEGVAVEGETLWLINDPWKENYRKNIRCEANRQHYDNMSPLLFSLPIDKGWFE